MKKLFKKSVAVFVCLIVLFCMATGCKSNGKATVVNSTYYTLQAAFDEGLISRADLVTISFLHSMKQQKTLSEEDESIIENSYRSAFPCDGEEPEINIRSYYGKYQNCHALMIGYVDMCYDDAIWSETINGVTFKYNNGQRIMICKVN